MHTRPSTADGNKPASPIWIYVVLFCYSLLVGLLVAHPPFQIFPVSASEAIGQVDLLASDVTHPNDLPDSGWKSYSLPDDWHHSQHQAEQIWYRTTWSNDGQRADHWGIYLPQVTHNAEVFVNNVWLGRGGKFEQPLSRHHNEPLLFPVSGELLTERENNIHIRVAAAHQSQGLMDQFYIAPLDELLVPYQWKHWLRFDFIRGVTIAMYFVAAVLFLFWLLRRQDSTYGIFASLLCVWATHNLNLFIPSIPVSARLWEAITMSTLGWAVVILVFFNHRYVGKILRQVENTLIGFSALGLGIFLLPSIELILEIGSLVWDSALILIGIYSIAYLLWAYHQTRELDIFLLLLAGIPILVCGFHDILVMNHLVDRRDGLIIQYSVVPAITLFSWFLVRRFVHSLNQAENLAATLEAKVKERGLKIEQQYQLLANLEKDRTLANERERIMRDMHDGIGGQLMSLQASLARHSEPYIKDVRARVQHCTDDLRVVINSLDPAMSDLTLLLGSMRVAIEKQLNGAGIRLVWNVSELRNHIVLSPEQSLNVLRIVQEAVANGIKHSSASQIGVLLSDVSESAVVRLEINDNGNGFDATSHAASQGRGLKNLAYRAEKLAATLSIESGEPGTKIGLLLDANRLN